MSPSVNAIVGGVDDSHDVGVAGWTQSTEDKLDSTRYLPSGLPLRSTRSDDECGRTCQDDTRAGAAGIPCSRESLRLAQ